MLVLLMNILMRLKNGDKMTLEGVINYIDGILESIKENYQNKEDSDFFISLIENIKYRVKLEFEE